MAHETHHETSHGTEKTSKTSSGASFWFVLILVGLFIAAVNFVNVTGSEHEEGEKTGHMHGTHEAAGAREEIEQKGSTSETHAETGAAEAHGETAQPAADTAHH
jgi:hypothetical protein